jgi:fructokinase
MPTSPSGPIVVGLGEALWDIFGDTRKPGGATANIAYHAAQLGAHGVIASRFGKDELGAELARYFDSKGIDTSYLQYDPEHGTGRVLVDTSDPGHPTYIIQENVSFDYLAPQADFLQLADKAAAVCFGTLAQRSPVSRDAVQQFIRRTRGLVVFDVNLRQHFYDCVSLDLSFERAGIVKLNLDEMPIVATELGLVAETEQAFADSLSKRYPTIETVIVTRAEQGCFVASGDEVVDLPGEVVTVVDAVGSGDAFTAAFIMLTLEGQPLAVRARFANRVGGLVATKAGAMPEVQAEYAQLRHEFGV